MTRRADGFSLIELLIAMAIMIVFGGALLSLVRAGESMARMQPEAADVQQRARIALQVLGSELAFAGAGLDRGPLAGPLAQFFAPAAPSADGGITIWYVSSRMAQATLAVPLVPGETSAYIRAPPECPIADPACTFSDASTALVFDGHGCRDVVRVDRVTGAALDVRAGARGCTYPAGAALAQGEVRTYRVDAASRQLLRRDEATGASVPLLDNVLGMDVEFLDAGRRIRVTLRLSPAFGNPLVTPLEVSCDARPPNLQGA
ncbi:MAG TPA: prepilin-type N-terminal cleavage/methylation domain-containing protein [Vicinamibacterales bacterium]|nr:prepilin-type N-terminal cleavage/methylation domain-containing protein [Vicinamibacterales bacterium]